MADEDFGGLRASDSELETSVVEDPGVIKPLE